MATSSVGASLRHSRYEGFRATIRTVGTGVRGSRALTFEEAREAIAALLAGEVSDTQAGAFLVAMRIKGEQPDELAGMAQALRDVAPTARAQVDRPLVACAGAYDGTAEAPQLSLAVGVVAAACGVGVVMHCGDTLGPKRGTTVADVLAALGGPARPTLAESRAMLERCGACVVHAGVALPGWSHLAELRDEIGLRGPVHSAEKLVDWFGARRFVVGHTHASYAERLVGALDRLAAERAIAVRGLEGSDVMRPGRPTAYERGANLELPELLGARLPSRGGAEESAWLTRVALRGEGDDLLAHTVALSAGVRLYAAGLAPDALIGAREAREALRDGRAAATLSALLAG
jgi:anthranilate phosphoribosyltransferase